MSPPKEHQIGALGGALRRLIASNGRETRRQVVCPSKPQLLVSTDQELLGGHLFRGRRVPPRFVLR